MSKDARELVAEMSAVYRDAEEARVANYARLNQDAQLRDRPICAGQTVWILFLEPVTFENAINHPGYVLLVGEVRDTRETSYEVTIAGRVQTFAEIDPAEKHTISHRADAFAKLVADQFGTG